MRLTSALTATLGLLGVPIATWADVDEDARSVNVRCSYSDYKTFQSEKVSIEATQVGNDAEWDASTTFRRGKNEDVSLVVVPGTQTECVFPSGNRVRVKVGEGESRVYGMCGANPEVFASIWVNERKIASRVWFTGYCREDWPGNPDVSFKISGGSKPSVEKCHAVRSTDTAAAQRPPTPPKPPLSVCVDYPEVSRFPRDEREYPRKGHKPPQPGEIKLLTGSHAVCSAALQELKADFQSFVFSPDTSATRLPRPKWHEASVELPKELSGSLESVFDFDNDGRLDRVFSRRFESTYIDGSVLLVQPGRSASALNVAGSPMDRSSWFIPCQTGANRPAIQACPVFSQKHDEAGFAVKGPSGKDSAYFRARYTVVSPFTFKGMTYLGASRSGSMSQFVAVLRPHPNRTLQPMCLFEKVMENF